MDSVPLDIEWPERGWNRHWKHLENLSSKTECFSSRSSSVIRLLSSHPLNSSFEKEALREGCSLPQPLQRTSSGLVLLFSRTFLFLDPDVQWSAKGVRQSPRCHVS